MTIQEFLSCREFFSKITDLESVEDSALFRKLISENHKTLEMLKYLTPNYVEIFIDSVFPNPDYDELEPFVAGLFGVPDDTHERSLDWCIQRFEEVYSRCSGGYFKGRLIDSLNEYFEATRENNPELRALPRGSFPKAGIREYIEEELYEVLRYDEYGDDMGTLTLYIDWGGSTYFKADIDDPTGWFLLFLKSEFLFNSIEVDRGSHRTIPALNTISPSNLYIRKYPAGRVPPNSYDLGDNDLRTLIPNCIAGKNLPISRSEDRRFPAWVFYEPAHISFFEECFHLTSLFKNKPIAVTPDQFRSKTPDYETAPWATFERKFRSVSGSEENSRAIAFAWSKEAFCENVYDDGYGDDVLLLLPTASLEGIKASDEQYQTIVLLSEIDFIIPLRFRFNFPEIDEYTIWAGSDAEGIPAIREVFSQGAITQNVCEMVESILQGLHSGKYAISNLESAPWLD